MRRQLTFISLIVLLLAGCSKSPQEKWDEYDKALQEEGTSREDTAEATATPEVQTANTLNTNFLGLAVSLPPNVQSGMESYLSVTAGESTPLEYYSTTNDFASDELLAAAETNPDKGYYHQYILLDNGEWEVRPNWQLNDKIETFLEENPHYYDLTLFQVKRGKNGLLYASGFLTVSGEFEDESETGDELPESGYSLFSLGSAGEEFHEIPLAPLMEASELDDDSFGRVFPQFDVLQTGEVYVQYFGMNAIIDSLSGEIIQTIELDSLSPFASANTGENEIFSTTIMSSEFYINDALTGDLIATINHFVHEGENSSNWKAVSRDQSVYLADLSGLYRAEFTAKEFKQLAALEDYPEFNGSTFMDLIVDERENIYLVYMKNSRGSWSNDSEEGGGAEEDSGMENTAQIIKFSPETE